MNKLEDIFKKSLENAEAPYDAKAWDSMVFRLDKVMPITPLKGSFKWAWVAGVVLIAGSSAIVLFNQETKTKEVKTVQLSKIENETSDKTQSTELINSGGETQEISVISNEVNKTEEINKISQRAFEKGTEKMEKSTPDFSKVSSDKENKSVEFSSSENGVTEIVKPIKELNPIPFEEKGMKEVIVPKIKIDFTVSNETFYEKGLPFNSLICNIEAKQYEWTNEKGEVLSTEKNADIHLFTSGTHSITLTIVNLNGEKQSVTKPVRCEVNYNLLAVTGFNPSSSDYRNNTFLPFALLKTERNIPFDMQIVDPKTGQVIFETNNADLPWDGMDRRTNQMVPINSTYIWKVNIHEKAIGEPTSRYQGTITRI